MCGVQYSMPVRLGHWQNQTSKVCSGMTGQWSDRSAMSGCKTLSEPGPMSYFCSLALRIWTSFWRREGSAGMDMWNALMVQSRQPFTYRLMESVGLGGPTWHGSSWQRGIAESGSSWLPTLMIEICGDLMWDLPCVQQASCLEGGPLMWMLPLYLHVNQKSNSLDIQNVACWVILHAFLLPVDVFFFNFSKKPTDLDLHCLPFTMWNYVKNLDQVIWLAEYLKRAWHLNLFSRTRVKNPFCLPLHVHVFTYNYSFLQMVSVKQACMPMANPTSCCTKGARVKWFSL